MPESLTTIRDLRSYVEAREPEEGLIILKEADLSPDEEFFFWYGDDPVRYVKDCFNWGPDEGIYPYQEDILNLMAQHYRVSARGPHGLGKTGLAAWSTNWFADTRDGLIDWKVITTASAWRQLEKYLWPEIHKWIKRKKWEVIGREQYRENYELVSKAIRLADGEAFAASSDDHELIEGAHASSIFYIYDESKRIKEQTFDASEGAFSTAGVNGKEAYGLMVSTPGEPSGRFHAVQTFKPGFEDWKVRPVSLEECIEAGSVGGSWARQRERQWGKTSTIYINRVLGNFASSDKSSTIPASWIERAMERWEEVFQRDGEDSFTWRVFRDERPMLEQIGVDVAGSGLDSTIFTPRFGYWVPLQKQLSYTDKGRQVAEAAIAFRSKLGGELSGAIIHIDANGIGSSAYEVLEETTDFVEPWIGSHGTYWRDTSGILRFKYIRSAAYWHMRQLLDPETGKDVALPPSDVLLGELSAPSFGEVGGKVQVEPKKQLTARLGKSPDWADSCVLAFWEVEETPRPRARAISLGGRRS